MNQAHIERNLTPSNAHALTLTRQDGGINRIEALAHDGHCSLGQRVSDLTALGYIFAKQTETVIDNTGKPHRGLKRYFCLGWSEPQPTQSTEVAA